MRTINPPQSLLRRLKVRLGLYEIVENSVIFDDSEDLLLEEMLESAKELLLSFRYPTGVYPQNENGEYVIERKHESWIVRCCEEMYGKSGGSGQVGHTENSIARKWDSGTISQSLIAEIVPIVGVAR